MAAAPERSLLNRLQLALVRAITLLGEAGEHHALSYRSFSMMEHYALILPVFAQAHLNGLPDGEKPRLDRALEWVQITLDSAKKERANDFEHVKRNAVIVLAAIVEGAFESVLATCLRHLATDQVSLKELTGHKGRRASERDLIYAVRTWEKNLYRSEKARSQRMLAMISTFFPAFELPSASARLDAIFERRNKLVHELIVVTDEMSNESPEVRATMADVDQFFDVAGDLIIAMIKAIPGDLKAPLPVFDPRFRAADPPPGSL